MNDESNEHLNAIIGFDPQSNLDENDDQEEVDRQSVIELGDAVPAPFSEEYGTPLLVIAPPTVVVQDAIEANDERSEQQLRRDRIEGARITELIVEFFNFIEESTEVIEAAEIIEEESFNGNLDQILEESGLPITTQQAAHEPETQALENNQVQHDPGAVADNLNESVVPRANLNNEQNENPPLNNQPADVAQIAPESDDIDTTAISGASTSSADDTTNSTGTAPKNNPLLNVSSRCSPNGQS